MPTDANTVVESSPTEEVQDSGVDLESLSEEQYNSWRLDGTLPEAKPETPPPSTKTDAAPDESGKPKGNQEAGKGKGVKERNAQLDGEIQELEARLARKADLKRQLESDNGAKTDPPPVTETKPAELKAPIKPKLDINNFKTWEEYEAAKEAASDKYLAELADFKAEQAVQRDRAQRAEEAAREKQQAEGRTRAEKWNKQVEAAGKAHPDWDEKIDPVMDLIKSQGFALGADFLVDSDVGAEIVYHLGSNPDEAREIAGMSPTKQVAALAVIAHTLSKPAESEKKMTPPGPKKVSETPPPPSEFSGRNQLAPDPVQAAIDAGDVRAYIDAQNALDIADIAAGRKPSGR